MNNQKYWERRKAQQMYEYMDEAEKVSAELERVYKQASMYIQKEAQKIFDKFQSKYDLTRVEAELLLKNRKTPQDIEALRRLLQEDKKNVELLKEYESQAYKARIDRLSNLYGQLDSIVLPMIAAERSKNILLYEKLAEESYYQSIFDLQQYSGYGFNFKALDKKTIKKVLDTRWSGKNFSQAIWDNTHALAESVKKEILINLLTGRPLREAQQAIDNEFGKGYNKARRLVRTESAYVCNQIQRESYKACGIEKYIYVAILDLKTSLICRGLDKEVFPVSEAKVAVNYPPMHPWCRSTTIAYVSKDVLAKMKQSAIDPATGKRITVPGDMTYKEWYDKYVKQKVAFTSSKESSQKSEASEQEQARLLSITNDAHEVAGKYVTRDSKWSGKTRVLKDGNGESGRKEWNCDISLIEGATRHMALHEELHARSISHYDSTTYKYNKPMEELPVELLSREICRAEGWDITSSSVYKEIKYLTYINKKAKIAENSLEFAKMLFDVPVTQRAKWLDDRIFDASPGQVEYNRTKQALERILEWQG